MTEYTVLGSGGDSNGFRHYKSIADARAYAVRSLKKGYKERAKYGGFFAPNLEIRSERYDPIGIVGMGTVRNPETGRAYDFTPDWFFYSQYSTDTIPHTVHIVKSDGTLGKRLE